jgi:hypothetical protein
MIDIRPVHTLLRDGPDSRRTDSWSVLIRLDGVVVRECRCSDRDQAEMAAEQLRQQYGLPPLRPAWQA